jgi:hypothetical protein
MLLLMLVANPYMFGYNHVSDANTLIMMVFLTSVLIPVIAILVMKGIGWVHSLQMSDRHERIGPYLVTSILYLTLYLHLVKAKSFPPLLLIASLGAVIALFAGFFFNNFRKISMHAIAMGALLMMIILLYSSYATNQFILPLPFYTDVRISTVYLLYVAIFLAGIVCSARLITDSHSPWEVYAGVIVGLVSMGLASLIID